MVLSVAGVHEAAAFAGAANVSVESRNANAATGANLIDFFIRVMPFMILEGPALAGAICSRPGLHSEHPTAEEGC
jgi:hypothetical protein